MGTVLRFPAERVRGALYATPRPQVADILILPVVRIEREVEPECGPGLWHDDGAAAPGYGEASPGDGTTGRRRSPRR